LSWAIGHSSFFETGFAFDSFRTSRTGIDDQQLGRLWKRTARREIFMRIIMGLVVAGALAVCFMDPGFGREKSGSIGSIG
jgi:hypothetical protein